MACEKRLIPHSYLPHQDNKPRSDATSVICVIILRLHVVLIESKLIHILVVVVWIVIVVTMVQNGHGVLRTLYSPFISPSPGQQA